MNYTLQSRQEGRFPVLELSLEVAINQLNTVDDKGKGSLYISMYSDRGYIILKKESRQSVKVKNYADLSTYCIILKQNIPASIQSRPFYCRLIALLYIGMTLFVVFRQRCGERET